MVQFRTKTELKTMNQIPKSPLRMSSLIVVHCSVDLNACESSITFYREPQLQLITIDARGPPPWIDCSEYAVLPVRKTALKRSAVDTPTANYLEVSCILSWDSTVDVYYGVTPAIMSRWWQETKPELRTGEHEFTCVGLPYWSADSQRHARKLYRWI